MRLGPEARRNNQGIHSLFLPPGALIAAPVEFPMMKPADGYGEAVADLARHRSLLCELDVVRIRGGTAADDTGLSGDKPQMIAIALGSEQRQALQFATSWTRPCVVFET